MIAIILMLLFVSAPSLSEKNVQASSRWLTYKGAWFEVRYPSNFKVRPSQRSSSASGYDSVFFTAPDGSVEFYVFSPQWNGEPGDIAVNTRTETIISQTSDRKASRIVRRATLRAKDGSYSRSFEDTEDTDTNTRRVFGIKYSNENAYNRYRQTYLSFKQSLRQFAD